MAVSQVQRRALLAAAGSDRLRTAVESTPVTRGLVRRFVPGTADDDVLRAAADLRSAGLLVSVDHLGEDTTEVAQARAARDAYVGLLGRLAASGLADGGGVEVSLKLSALGQALPVDGDRIAVDHARQVCEAAALAGTTVTVDMEDHTTTAATLAALATLRQDFPQVGAVIQAQLHRSVADCRELAALGARVRLCKGAYAAPAELAFTDSHEVDRSFVRCLKELVAGGAYPMVATHDPVLLDIAEALASQHALAPDAWETQLLYGVRTEEQQRLAGLGRRVRVYLPYGEQWYGYLVRRLAERPANLAFLLRSLASRR